MSKVQVPDDLLKLLDGYERRFARIEQLLRLPGGQSVKLATVSGAASASVSPNYSSTSGTPVFSNGTTDTQLTINTTTTLLWIVIARMTWRSSEAVFSTMEWGLNLTPADRIGQTDMKTYTRVHSDMWNSGSLVGFFQLDANKEYTVSMKMFSSSNSSQYHSRSPEHLQLAALQVAHGMA